MYERVGVAASALLFPLLLLPAQQAFADATTTDPDTATTTESDTNPPTGPNIVNVNVEYPFLLGGNSHQTAFKEGDELSIQVTTDADANVAGDFSAVGDASPVSFGKYDTVYENLPITIGSAEDGTKDIIITAANANGTTTIVVPILLDNTPPTATIMLSGPKGTQPVDWDTMLFSGMFDGTGSSGMIRFAQYDEFNADGARIDRRATSQTWDVLNTIPDGTFTNVEAPVLPPDPAGTYIVYDFTVTDGAGNSTIATSSPLLIHEVFGGAASTSPPEEATSTCTSDCLSNVLFLPGIEGSRLYDADGQLWEPGLTSGNASVKALALASNGQSVRDDIYTTSGDILQSPFGTDVYQSFTAGLNAFCSVHGIECTEVPYDWRLSLSDIVNNGNQNGNDISYSTGTSTPYIEQTLHSLAAHSKTGKVTIIAHSNGGLVAKALMQKLGDAETANLVDTIIFVGVPQSGAPEAVGQLLVGYNAGLPDFFPLVISPAAARTFAQNAPMAYHLLPSEKYFSDLQDSTHPVISFAGGEHAFAAERAAYGPSVDTEAKLASFLLANEGGRVQPDPTDLTQPMILNDYLVAYGEMTHKALDSWRPPSGVMLYQIAGWGVDTVSGIDFYELPWTVQSLFGFYKPEYRPDFVEDGDGVVPAPSALMIPVADNVKSYWLDISLYDFDNNQKRDHSSILGIPSLESFIKNIISNSDEPLPSYISLTPPVPNQTSKELRFYIHSPVSLDLHDSSGNHTGISDSGTIDENIPGSTYGTFGEVKYITVPAGADYTLSLKGQDTGTFSLDIQEASGDTITSQSTIANVPTTAQTTASLSISNGIGNTSALHVDEDGDGTADFSITPLSNQMVTYGTTDSPVTEKTTSSGSSSSSKAVVATTTSFQNIGTTTARVSIGPSSLQTKKIELGPGIIQPATQSTELASSTTRTQTASVYDAFSQQHWFTKMLNRLYSWIQVTTQSVKTFFATFLRL